MLLIIILLYFLINGVIAYEFHSIAEEKGYDGGKYFAYTLIFGIIGMLMVVALPDRGDSRRDSWTVLQRPPVTYSQSPVTPSSEQPGINHTTTGEKHNDEPATEATIENGEKICPKCGTRQRVERSVCWNCGVHFTN